MNDFPAIGHGIGLRPPHFVAMSTKPPVVDWVEVISENFMVAGGNPRAVLRRVRERMPVVLHGVSLSLGSVDPLDAHYLDALDNLAREIEPAWLSDHLCWSSFGGHTGHDLWPLPFTEEALSHVVERVARVQERLRRRILLENVSSYLQFASSALTEWEFLAELCRRADCGVLLDVNNVFVSAYNHGFSPQAFLDGIPVDRVGQIHLAGHSDEGTHLLDTHDHPVCDGVWDLYRAAVTRFGPIPTLIERDDDIPPLEELVAESRRAAQIEREVRAARAESSVTIPPAVVAGPRPKRDAVSKFEPLPKLQELFYDLVTAPTGVGPGLVARGLAAADLEAIIAGDHRLSAARRLDIYADMYFYRILDVLRDEFPRVVAAVGDVAFHDLVTDFLLAHRPSHPSLREAGANLAAYLARHALGVARPWLPELARLERAHRELFDGADVPTLTLEALRGLPANTLVRLAVRLSPTHAVFNFAFALSTIWSSVRPPQPPEPAARPESLLVWRQDFEVRHREVDGTDEAAMLAVAAGGATIAELCETMIAQTPQPGDDAPTRAFQILARWIDDGLVTRKSEATTGRSA
jgi:uncharacterized protein (UPF0276 family)